MTRARRPASRLFDVFIPPELSLEWVAGSSPGDVDRLLATVELIRTPTWRRAADGDAAAAIGLALDLARRRVGPVQTGLIMLALCRCARSGDPAAVAAFAFMAKRWKRDLEVTDTGERR